MVIGNGDIASVLPDRDDLLFFASGVSNSGKVYWREYEREKQLLLSDAVIPLCRMKGAQGKRLVYFSSLGILDGKPSEFGKSSYYCHKIEMEWMVRHNFPKYTIIRLGNITWGKNPHTIINFFKDKILKKEPLDIRDEYRFLVDKDEFLFWIDRIPDWNCEMSIPGRRLKVADIVKEIKEGKL